MKRDPRQLNIFEVLGEPVIELRTRSHRGDPETSPSAIASIAKHLPAIQAKVLLAFEKAGSKGLTDDDLAKQFPFSSYSTYRTRRGELVAKGLIADTGRRVVKRGGRQHVVWALAAFVTGVSA